MQKTAYEMRIIDWSSDVCSSDLGKDALQSLEAGERQRHLHPHDGRPGDTSGSRTQDDHDRRDLSQSAPHGIQPWGKKGGPGRLIGRTKGGMNTKLHAVTDANGRPISFFMTAGQVSDYTGAAALLDSRSEEHTSELQSLMRISYAVFCLKQKKKLDQTSA